MEFEFVKCTLDVHGAYEGAGRPIFRPGNDSKEHFREEFCSVKNHISDTMVEIECTVKIVSKFTSFYRFESIVLSL